MFNERIINANKHLKIENISLYRNEIYGICAIWIMFFHGVILDKVHLKENIPLLYSVLSFGNCAVDVFLFLAGIGTYSSLSANNDYDNFLKKRMRRVLPVYLLWGGISWSIIDLMLEKGDFSSVVYDLSLYSFWKDGHELFWYVALILLLYAIAPIVYYSMHVYESGKYRSFSLFVWMAAVFAVNAYLKNVQPDTYKNIEIAICRIPVFILGCFVGYYVHSKRNFCKSIYIFSFLVTLLSSYICSTGYLPVLGFRYTYMVLGVSITITLAVILSAVRIKFLHKILSYLGSISLELYIVHIALRRMFVSSSFYKENCFTEYCLLLVVAIVISALLHTLTLPNRRKLAVS